MSKLFSSSSFFLLFEWFHVRPPSSESKSQREMNERRRNLSLNFKILNEKQIAIIFNSQRLIFTLPLRCLRRPKLNWLAKEWKCLWSNVKKKEHKRRQLKVEGNTYLQPKINFAFIIFIVISSYRTAARFALWFFRSSRQVINIKEVEASTSCRGINISFGEIYHPTAVAADNRAISYSPAFPRNC